MVKMRMLVWPFGLFICCAFLFLPAHAWEVSLKGNLFWTYEYYNQQGRQGFFGPYDDDRSGAFGYSGKNFWYGTPRLTYQSIVTGSDAAAQYMYLTVMPEIVINKALKVQGEYRVGGWNDYFGPNYVEKFNSYYLADTAVGTEVALGEGHWTRLVVSAHTPWGVVAYGKRPKGYGTGLQYDEQSGSSESLLIRSDYGPFVFGVGLYPARLSLGARKWFLTRYEEYFSQYPNRMDKSWVPEQDLEGFVVYRNGPMELGFYGAYSSYHVGPELRPDLYSQAVLNNIGTEIGNTIEGTAYIKYTNGRFFFNAESAFLGGTKREKRLSAQTPLQLQAPTYVEQWRYMVETGVVVGPAKLSLLYAFTPGLDRRAGILIDRQPSPMLRQPFLSRSLATVSMWRPYAYIMPYLYNSGLPMMLDTTALNVDMNFGRNNHCRLDSMNREGQMLDATVVAARFDYALAANLNLFLSIFAAQRTSDGYGWGCIMPSSGRWGALDGSPNFWYMGSGDVLVTPNRSPESPTIPDKSLGHEFNVGINWRLLEGWDLGILVGRWEPGKWFSYACIDRRVTSWPWIHNAANNYGAVPDKKIDPVWATNVTLAVEF